MVELITTLRLNTWNVEVIVESAKKICNNDQSDTSMTHNRKKRDSADFVNI